MSDREPYLFQNSLGALRPINGAASDAVNAIPAGSTVRVEIKKTTGNIKRLAWYWVMLKITLDNLEDAFDGPITTQSLHKWLKREGGYAKPIRSKKTGEIFDWDYDSMSFAKMTEDVRSQYVDYASKKLASRLGVDVATLRREAEQV